MEEAEWAALEERIRRAVGLIERLTGEERALRKENERLTRSLQAPASLGGRDKERRKREEIRERLGRLISRLEQLDI